MDKYPAKFPPCLFTRFNILTDSFDKNRLVDPLTLLQKEGRKEGRERGGREGVWETGRKEWKEKEEPLQYFI